MIHKAHGEFHRKNLRLSDRFEALFGVAAVGAYPVGWKVFKGRAGRDAVFRIALLRIINIAAPCASVLFHF
jgi:hypothetical protein